MVEIFLILRSRFVQSELSPQLRQTQRQLTSASDAPLTDTGPVIAERAALMRFASSESPATSSDIYSSTVFQPPSDLSAMRISLLRFFSFVIEPSKIETALDFLSDAIHFMAE
jgi:hypothetical protein